MERDLEDDMRNAPWFMLKIKDKTYAQNVYAALCNMRWQVKEVMPILKDEYWTCSWRSAGGIVAELRSQGEDYMDYYCSGIRNVEYDDNENKWWDEAGYASEGEVKDEIAKDLASIGWFPVPYKDDDLAP